MQPKPIFVQFETVTFHIGLAYEGKIQSCKRSIVSADGKQWPQVAQILIALDALHPQPRD